MGKFSELLGKRLRGQDEPFPKWRSIGDHYGIALKIYKSDSEQLGALLLEWRKAGKSGDVEQLREGLKALGEFAKLQLKVAEVALLKVDEATKPRLVPDDGQS
jgi:hypothetical protein